MLVALGSGTLESGCFTISWLRTSQYPGFRHANEASCRVQEQLVCSRWGDGTTGPKLVACRLWPTATFPANPCPNPAPNAFSAFQGRRTLGDRLDGVALGAQSFGLASFSLVDSGLLSSL